MNKIRIGIFGVCRGREYYSPISKIDELQIVAVCDRRPDKLYRSTNLLRNYPYEVKYFDNAEDFFNFPMDAVILCNYFHEHAKYAILALSKGIHVMTECQAAVTPKECVELVEAVEKSGKIYMSGENYPYTATHMEMKRLYDNGSLGKALYAQAEYNHSEGYDVLRDITPSPFHWRAYCARSFYSTHSLGPLMYMTGSMPKSVSARSVHSDELQKMDYFRHNYDALTFMDTVMDDGSLFHFTGCAAIPSFGRYRLVGENGSVETGGVLGGQIQTQYYSWATPKDTDQISTYAPDWQFNGDKAAYGGHGGGDYWAPYYFAQAILKNEQPYFDVYRAVAMSAVAIYGWRSSLNNGATYEIPDFRDVEQRNKVRDDDLTPFLDDEGNGGTLPCAMGGLTHPEIIARGLDQAYIDKDKLPTKEIKGKEIFNWLLKPEIMNFEKIGGDYSNMSDIPEYDIGYCLYSDGILQYKFTVEEDGKYNLYYFYAPANETNRGFSVGIDSKEDMKTYFGGLWIANMGQPRVEIPVELKAGEHTILVSGPKGFDDVNVRGVMTFGLALYKVED